MKESNGIEKNTMLTQHVSPMNAVTEFVRISYRQPARKHRK